MNRVLPAIATFIYMMFFTNASFAKFDPEESLEISFTNNTPYDCIAAAHLKRGIWHTKPPKRLKKYSVTSWVVLQTHYYGPDLTATFNCGGYSFSTRNQQNFSGFEGGDQTLSTSDVDKHLKVINKQVQHASCGKEKPGVAEIIVSPKGG
ncbi:hypothetical protein [Candidatus Sororendozoicomonas aggregata]|uniref:hypothetical protein n=1 Tax=Candidatus Sororendozoicomonas aggregata TaxID=3073239 RepID=UPI002ED673A0